MMYSQKKIVHSKELCFPIKCKAMEYCNKWKNIPKHYRHKIEDLNGTNFCTYKDAYNNYLNTDLWMSIRSLVIMKAKFKCQKCGNKENLDVHHLNYKSVFDEKLKDLILLCRKHHIEQHDK